VAAYLRCGGVVNYQIKKGLFLSLSVEMFFKSLNRLFGNVTSKSVAVSCTLFAWPMHCKKTKKVHETTTFLLVTLPIIWPKYGDILWLENVTTGLILLRPHDTDFGSITTYGLKAQAREMRFPPTILRPLPLPFIQLVHVWNGSARPRARR